MKKKMKNSGIEWVGEIPDNWKIERMKSCIALREGGAWGEEETGDSDTVCLRVADFDYDRFVFKNTSISALTKRHYSKSTVAKLKLLKGDIVIEKSGGGDKTPVGRTVIFDKDYVALFANFMDRLRCCAFVYPKFMQYIFVTFYKNQYTRNYIKQTTGIQNLDLSLMLNREHVPMPPIEEQKAMCGEVDALIADIQQEIETLEQYKRSVITEAVTKGLDSSAPMKDSGIEWVGEIPAHWGCKPIRALFLENNNKNCFRKETRALQFKNGEIVPKHNFNADDDEYVAETILKYNIVDKGMIVINGLNLNFDFVTKRVGLVHDRGIITSAYMSFSVKDLQAVMPKYACYLLKSYDNCAAFHNMGGGVRKILNFDELKHNLFILPSLSEQKAIADYLDDKCKEIEGIITDKQSQIETLEAYKKSLIYEYVTGKKEVVA